jgi:mono/diheme cytochrome c family protein
MIGFRIGWFVTAGALVALPLPATVGAEPRAQSSVESSLPGRELYERACAACHAADGRGSPQSLVGFETPLPDFTDCSFATREPDADWAAIAHSGGPVRAFDRRMPAFGEALVQPDIGKILEHIRTFCEERAWPRGELNIPRPLVTEKAYPEDEAVLTTRIGTGENGSVVNEFLYEKRLGARSQFEVGVPIALVESSAGWQRGLGDVAAALKHVLFHSLSSGSILSVASEAVLPTGKETQGLGGGVTMFEPFVTVGQLLPSNGFLHAQAGAELSTNRSVAGHEAFWRAAVGRTFEQRGFGRAWSPMVELVGARELESGARMEWDVVPQVQVSLSRRQHVLLSGGVRIPITAREGRHAEIVTYLLWDWFDGGLWDGW